MTAKNNPRDVATSGGTEHKENGLMSNPEDTRTPEQHADHIVAAYTRAVDGLVKLSDAIADAVNGPNEGTSTARLIAAMVSFSDSPDPLGYPAPRIGRKHGTHLLSTAADVRAQIDQLREIAVAGWERTTGHRDDLALPCDATCGPSACAEPCAEARATTRRHGPLPVS